MPYFERMRDSISGPISPDILNERTKAGWQIVAIEWRRELPGTERPVEDAPDVAIPYGLRISNDGLRLEADPTEETILTLMMALLVQDFSYASIVSDLNEKGYRMRNGAPWTRTAVFNMMPRLIEVGPRIFSSGEWSVQRSKFQHAETS